MKLTRRDLLKAGAATSAALGLGGRLPAARLMHAATQAANPRRRRLMDAGWRFRLGHLDDPARDFDYGRLEKHGVFAKADKLLAVADVPFDDSGWEAVQLPHDWAVALPFTEDVSTSAHGWKPLGRIYPETSVGWYRRRFRINAGEQGRRVVFFFEGVMRDALFFVNGYPLDRSRSGYTPFELDVTDYLSYGGDNVLVVRVDASQAEGWFYEGAGLYRHVWLESMDPVHILRDGVWVRTENIEENSAELALGTELRNETAAALSVSCRHRVLDPRGHEIASAATALQNVPSTGKAVLEARLTLPNPRRWSPTDPCLYLVETTLFGPEGKELDQLVCGFGVRTARFDAEQGFLLNGQRLAIQGTCNHQDHAGVGAAVPDWLWEERVRTLQSAGSNAHRIHHMNSTALMDCCDRLGMLVLAETRWESATLDGLQQLAAMVRRDRNRPSVIAWSLANEEPEQGTPRGAHILASMKALTNRLDPTRMVTAAMNGAFGQGFSDVVEVQGFNYELPSIDPFRAAHPNKPCLGTEVASTFFTRGEYRDDPAKGLVDAYDLFAPKWGETAEGWMQFYGARPWLSGGFVWTGYDYRGEPVPFDHVSVSSQFGILDTCGARKDIAEYYRAWWTNEPVLHLLPHWNWTAGETVSVWAFGNAERVELLLNGKSLGSQPMPRLGHVQWQVPFAPGVLEARGHMADGRQVLSRRLTAGPSARLVLSTRRNTLLADGEDGTQIDTLVVDAAGVPAPRADPRVHFTVPSALTLLGVGNGDPNSREPDVADQRLAFNGRCSVLLRAGREPGRFRVFATAEGLANGELSLELQAAVSRLAD